MKLIDWHSLKTRVVLFTLAIFLVSIWTLQTYASRSLRSDMETVISAQQLSTADTIATSFNNEFAERLQALEIYAADLTPEFQRSSAALQATLQEQRLLPLLFNAGVFVVGPNAVAIADSPHLSGRIGTNFKDRPNVMTALTQGTNSVSSVVIGKTLKAPIFTMAVPIRDREGQVIGAIVGITELGKPSFLSRVTQSTSGKGFSYLLVAPAQRQIILSSDKRQVMQLLPPPGTSPAMDRFVQGYEGTQTLTSTVGVQVISSVKGIPLAGWYIAVTAPVDEVFAPIDAMERNIRIAAIGLTLLAATLIWWVLGRELSPLLVAAKRLAATTDPTALPALLPVQGANEVRALMTAFNQQTEARKAKDLALAASELRYRHLFTNLRMGLILHASDTRIELGNRSALAMLGLTEDQLLGRTALDPAWNIIGEDDSPFPGHLLPVVIASATGQPVRNVVMGVYRPAGDRVWLSVSADPELQPDGTVFQIVVSLNDITESRQVQRDLVTSEARLRSIVEVSPIPMALNNNRLEVTYLNPAFVNAFGYTRSEIPTLADWWPRAYPDPQYQQQVIINWAAELAAANSAGRAFAPMEVTVCCKDGSHKSILASASMLSQSLEGEHLVVMFDLTPQIEAQRALQLLVQDKEALLREVHHRVKNNLQIIASLLRLESGRSAQEGTRSVLNDMTGRIRSMALLHESLYRSGTFASVDLGRYLSQLSAQAFRASMATTSAIELKLDLASVQVSMDQATPCGLLVNELISNCLKHGFPDGRSGEVRVSLQPEPDSLRWILCVSDTGVGLPESIKTEERQTLGLQLVSDLAVQLGGVEKFAPGSPGVTVTIAFTPNAGHTTLTLQ